jgi:hypothetical protein
VTCDFPQTYDVWFRPLFAFFIVDINTKRVVHVGQRAKRSLGGGTRPRPSKGHSQALPE